MEWLEKRLVHVSQESVPSEGSLPPGGVALGHSVTITANLLVVRKPALPWLDEVLLTGQLDYKPYCTSYCECATVLLKELRLVYAPDYFRGAAPRVHLIDWA